MNTDFKTSLRNSILATKAFPLRAALKQLVPGFMRYEFSSDSEDRQGYDLVVTTRWKTERFDLKLRSRDSRVWGEDDLIVEIYSVVESSIRGYQSRKTDRLLWLFTDTKRAVLFDFAKFREIYDRHFDEWEFWLSEPDQTTRLGHHTYHSRFAPVPFRYFASIAKEVTIRN